MLPKGVEKTTAKGRAYFYWNPGRGTAREGKRIKLPNAEAEPVAFWKELELYIKAGKPVARHRHRWIPRATLSRERRFQTTVGIHASELWRPSQSF